MKEAKVVALKPFAEGAVKLVPSGLLSRIVISKDDNKYKPPANTCMMKVVGTVLGDKVSKVVEIGMPSPLKRTAGGDKTLHGFVNVFWIVKGTKDNKGSI
jgi:hypothetical protein